MEPTRVRNNGPEYSLDQWSLTWQNWDLQQQQHHSAQEPAFPSVYFVPGVFAGDLSAEERLVGGCGGFCFVRGVIED